MTGRSKTAQTRHSTDDTSEFAALFEDLKAKAISAALANDWKEAVSINESILAKDKTNIDALNRLGYAFWRIGQTEKSRLSFLKVKKLDPYNQIAEKNLNKLESAFKQKISPDDQNNNPYPVSPLDFLEDPGKTKLVQCINIAPNQTLSCIHCGQEVFLKPKNHTIEIRDESNRYLAALPDDISFRLIKLMAGNNTYSCIVKNVCKNTVTVLLREISRGKKFANQPSFTSNTFSMGYLVKEMAPDIEKPDTSETGEEDLKVD